MHLVPYIMVIDLTSEINKTYSGRSRWDVFGTAEVRRLLCFCENADTVNCHNLHRWFEITRTGDRPNSPSPNTRHWQRVYQGRIRHRADSVQRHYRTCRQCGARKRASTSSSTHTPSSPPARDAFGTEQNGAPAPDRLSPSGLSPARFRSTGPR